MKKKLNAALLLAFLAPAAASAGEGSLTGLYAGAHLGLGAPSMTVEDSDCWYNCSAYTQRPSGLLYGIRVGQNLASGSLIYGWMLDYDFGSIDDEFAYGYYTGANDEMLITSEFKSALSLRAKGGLMIQDTALTLNFGWARGDFESTFNDRNSNTGNKAVWDIAKYDDSASGWVFGAGIEHALGNNLVIGADLSKYAFEDDVKTVTIAGGTESGSKVKFINDLDSLRLSVSYKFF